MTLRRYNYLFSTYGTGVFNPFEDPTLDCRLAHLHPLRKAQPVLGWRTKEKRPHKDRPEGTLQRVYWISLHIMAYHSMNSATAAMHSFFRASGCQNDKYQMDVKFALFILIPNRELRSPALTSATSKMVLRAALSNRQRFCAKGQSPEQSNMLFQRHVAIGWFGWLQWPVVTVNRLEIFWSIFWSCSS